MEVHQGRQCQLGSDTAWVDDIVITPTGGSGSGEGNWTSEVFGPSLLGRGENLLHGLLHMDALIYPGSEFEWQILDATTNVPVSGFERITTPWMDLGMIDVAKHPLLKFRVHMKEAADGGTSEIRSWSLNGHIAMSFDSDPTAEGWAIQSGSWSNGVISSTGSVLSDTYQVRSGFSVLDVNSSQSTNAQLQFSTDGGLSWTDIADNGRHVLEQPAYMAQFRTISTTSGAAHQWTSFEAELIRTSVPDGVRLDVGLDGADEWSSTGPDTACSVFKTRFSTTTCGPCDPLLQPTPLRLKSPYQPRAWTHFPLPSLLRPEAFPARSWRWRSTGRTSSAETYPTSTICPSLNSPPANSFR